MNNGCDDDERRKSRDCAIVATPTGAMHQHRRKSLLIILLYVAQTAWCCPEPCTCKWKNGKQTVECVDKGLALIPAGLDHGTQVLDFSGNNLHLLPKERFKTVGLINLQKVYMARCRIAKVDDAAFRGLSNLVELDLSQNLLLAVPSPIFADFSSLMKLILSENPIRALRSNGFQHLTFLTTLELSDCDVALIEDEAFIGLNHLEWLKLDGNKLTTMRGSHILPDTLHGVDLHNNKWQCDCNSQDLYAWLSNFNVPHTVEPQCNSPPRLSGRNIKSLSENDLACLPDVSPTTFYLEISEGKNVSLLCQVSAVPEAKVSWWFQGQVLQNDSMVAPGIHLYYYIEEGTVEKRSELFIYNTNSEDNGTFACIAENPAGKSQSNYTIRVIVKEEPIVIVVTFPYECVLTIAAIGGLVFIAVLVIVTCIVLKCNKRKKHRKKKESSKDVAMQYPTNVIKNGANSSCPGALPVKLNGSLLVTDQHHHVSMYSPASRDMLLSSLDGSVCFNTTTTSRTYQTEQNPDLINDTESVGNGVRKSINDEQANEADEEADNIMAMPPPPRQVKWQDQQQTYISTLPRPPPCRTDMYQLVADVHLNPGCFLDADGYPIDFGLPKLQQQQQQQPILVTDGANNFYRTLPHNRSKMKASGGQQVRFSREAEYFVRTNAPPSYEHYAPTDVRYTVEGYPYTPALKQYGIEQPDGTFVPSPPEGYKSETPPIWPHCVPVSYLPQMSPHLEPVGAPPSYVATRCVPTQTTESSVMEPKLDSVKVKPPPPLRQSSSLNSTSSATAGTAATTPNNSSSAKDQENSSESPDEGYVGEATEI